MTKKYPAQFYNLTGDGFIECKLCPHNCKIKNNSVGICKVRKNIDAKLYSLNFAQLSALGVDPIEKKPLYHFYPNSEVLSLGSWGCNMSCLYCQNWQISQQRPKLKEYQPQELIEIAKNKNIKFIAYTYSEPIVFYEYMLETAKLAAQEGIKNIMVTNGFINQKPLEKLLEYLDAVNIDLKAFNNDFYKNTCGASLAEVKKTIKFAADKVHLELTTLIIRDLNDDLKELEAMFKWVAEINHKIPLHLSRYYPSYKLDKPATDLKLMKKAYKKAKKYLSHIYLGNTIIKGTADSYCSSCGEKLISRKQYTVENKLNKNKCNNCGADFFGSFK